MMDLVRFLEDREKAESVRTGGFQKSHDISIYLGPIPDIGIPAPLDSYWLWIVDDSLPGPGWNKYSVYVEKEGMPNPGDWLDREGLRMRNAGYKCVRIYYDSLFIGHYGSGE